MYTINLENLNWINFFIFLSKIYYFITILLEDAKDLSPCKECGEPSVFELQLLPTLGSNIIDFQLQRVHIYKL